MKDATLIVTVCMALFCVSGTHASNDASNDVSRLAPQFIAQTNGMLAVCALDHGRGVLLRLKGIEIDRSQLPQSGRPCVYELGERPSASTNLWKVPKEYFHFYGTIPYPVEDIDPALSSYWSGNGSLLVGVRLGGRFYTMKNLGQVPKNAAATKAVSIQPPLNVIEVKLLQHRRDDLESFSKKEQTKYSPAERDSSPLP